MERPMKHLFLLIVVVAVVGAVIAVRPDTDVPVSAPASSSPEVSEEDVDPGPSDVGVVMPSFVPPLDRAGERVTKKPFGMLVTPETSPVRPDRFSGYHTGTDFEIFPEEADTEVGVDAICDGEIVAKRYASGYGGVLVERCSYEGAPVTVVYGHLALGGIAKSVGDTLARGETIGSLGAAGSVDADGERKHLHLGIRRGDAVDIRGYVGTRDGLSEWIDPCKLVCPASSDGSDRRILFQNVPFTSQAPGGQWADEVFQNACEEASILMAAAWAKGQSLPGREAVERTIRELSALAEKFFGVGALDTSAEDTAELFREYAGTDARLREGVTLADIKDSLAAGDLVVAPFDGRRLGNPYFTPPGPEYHMLVIVGYDPELEVFIVNDPGTRRGEGYRYDERVLFSALRDYETGHHKPIPIMRKSMIVVSRD